MKIINGKELGYMPDGTVFSDIAESFDPNKTNGCVDIKFLNIMCGHGKWCPVESGKFNGVLHMLGYIDCYGTHVGEDDFDTITDTDSNDYTKNDWVVVYEKEEVEKIIKNLQWALNGCKD